jgi:hypothetical protein
LNSTDINVVEAAYISSQLPADLLIKQSLAKSAPKFLEFIGKTSPLSHSAKNLSAEEIGRALS